MPNQAKAHSAAAVATTCSQKAHKARGGAAPSKSDQHQRQDQLQQIDRRHTTVSDKPHTCRTPKHKATPSIHPEFMR